MKTTRKTKTLVGAIVVVLVLGWSFVPAAAQGNCTTRWNQWARQFETHCSDGSSATERYNPWAKQWDTTITPGFRPGAPSQRQQNCTTRYNQWARQWETTCY